MKELDTLPLIKCLLIDKSTDESIDITSYIDEWENLEITMSRDGTSGVLSEVSLPINLILAGKEFLKEIFDRDGLYGNAILEIHRRGDMDNEYSLLKEMPLDFSTYKEYDDRITIESAKSDLIEIINSEGKTKYNIPVNEIKEEKPWKYERINFMNRGGFEIPTDTDIHVVVEKTSYIYIPFTLNNSELIPGSEIIFKGQEPNIDFSGGPFKEYFIEYFGSESASIQDIIIKNLSINIRFPKNADSKAELSLSMFRYNKNNDDKSMGLMYGKYNFSKYSEDNDWVYYSLSIERYNTGMGVQLFPNDRLCFVIKIDTNLFFNLRYTITSFGKFYIGYIEKSKDVLNIDVISPQNLIQKYVNLMSGETRYKANIQWDEGAGEKIMIVASESIRQFDNATLHGSPNDFFEWMRVLGYEYEVSGKNLNFKRRDLLFPKTKTSMLLGESEVADLIIQSNGEYAYTSLEIGYKKQDYNSINGRCEANGTFEYTTGYTTREDNKLSLISPYRADSIGIELLSQETTKESADNESDNDIFCVMLSENNNSFSIKSSDEISDLNFGITMFNSRLNPYFLVERNESLIGINAKSLKFKSTDMSRTAYISGISMYKDWTITKKLFSPIEYNLATGSHKNLPGEYLKNGCVKLTYNGKEYKGFIKEIRKNYAAETEETWILQAVKENQ